MTYLYILEIKPLWFALFANIFSQSVGFLIAGGGGGVVCLFVCFFMPGESSGGNEDNQQSKISEKAEYGKSKHRRRVSRKQET